MVLISLVPVLTPLYLYVSTFRSMCAVPNMAVSCSSLISWFPGMLLTHFLNDFEITIIIIILGISFMQGIYTYIPEANHVPKEHRVAGILVLLFPVFISLVPALTPLYLYVSTLLLLFRRFSTNKLEFI
jgi:hypothetical protein